MPNRNGQKLIWTGYLSASGVGKSGLTDVTVNGWEITIDGVVTQVETDADAIETGGGFYHFIMDASKNDADAKYDFKFITADETVDAKEVAGEERSGQDWTEFIDAAISTIGAVVAASAPASAEGTIEVKKYNTLYTTISNLVGLATWEFILFTVKRNTDAQTDAQSDIQIRLTSPGDEDDGLQFINRLPAATAANGAISDVSVGDGTLVVRLDVTEMLKLNVDTYKWGLKVKRVTEPDAVTIATGIFDISDNPGRATD